MSNVRIGQEQMTVSRTARIVAGFAGGVLAVGAVSAASASPILDEGASSSASSENRPDLVVRSSAAGAATLVSLDVPWEPGDTVAVTAEPPAPEPEPVATTSASGSVASRSVGVGECGVGGTWPNQVRSMITNLFGITNIGGYRAGDPGDHGSGLALDVMVPISSGLGDSVAEWAVANQGSLNVNYVIWKQRINMGGGWSGMEDRGSATANHYDHVHISLNPGWGSCS